MKYTFHLSHTLKTKNFYLLFSSVALSSILVFNTCQKNDPCKGLDLSTDTVTYNLSNMNKANVYKGNDTLVFISNAGDTAILYGQNKKDYYVSNLSQPSSADCPKYAYYQYENFDLIFSGNNTQLYKIEYHGYVSTVPQEVTDISVNNYTSGYSATYFRNTLNYFTQINIKGINYNCLLSDYPPYTYYNQQYGILRIDSINGKNWTLNK